MWASKDSMSCEPFILIRGNKSWCPCAKNTEWKQNGVTGYVSKLF